MSLFVGKNGDNSNVFKIKKRRKTGMAFMEK